MQKLRELKRRVVIHREVCYNVCEESQTIRENKSWKRFL